METAFNKSHYFSKSMLKQLAEQSGRSERKIDFWFRNKRQALKFGRKQEGPSSSKDASIHAYN